MYSVHRGKIWPKFCNSIILSHVDIGQVKLADRVTIGCPVCHLSGDVHNTSVQILSVHCSKSSPSPLSRFQRFSFHSSAFGSNACSVLGLYDIYQTQRVFSSQLNALIGVQCERGSVLNGKC